MRSEDHEYFVYILASRLRTLYIGVTNNLKRRMQEHREGTADSFTAQYRIHRLVYFERWQYVGNAIAREKYLTLFASGEDGSDQGQESDLFGFCEQELGAHTGRGQRQRQSRSSRCAEG